MAPFEALQALDARFCANASGLPANKPVNNDWVGVGFQINGVALLAKMDEVSEILPPPATIRVPGVKPWVKGLANIRGSLLPVFDMNLFLNGEFTVIGKENRVLIINKNGLVAGLLVEQVHGLRRFKPAEHSNEIDPQMGAIKPYMTGIFVDRGHQWNVFSVEKLIRAERFLRVV